MKRAAHDEPSTEDTDPRVDEATRWFLRVHSESAGVEDLPEFRTWLERDARNAIAYRQVAVTWKTLGTFSLEPEIVTGRRDALDDARRAARRRWTVRTGWPRYAALVASIFIVIVGGVTWLYSQRGVYTTAIGERRMLTLQDGSLVNLDAQSRIRVQYAENERLITLERGQARFDVRKDHTRPFRVRAGSQTVVALGTQFNVELLAGNVLVSMIEGRVAVMGVESLSPTSTSVHGGPGRERVERAVERQAQVPVIELRGGEGLRVRKDGRALVLAKVDLARATAWQSGKMFFDNEPLASAAERINRYSQLRIEVDPSAADLTVNGVFNAGDSSAFIEAISTYFPVNVDRIGASGIRLTARN